MSMVKYAKFEGTQILDIKGAPKQNKEASLSRLSEFSEYNTESGFLYARIRAISSRVNQNHDSWPSVELAGSPDVLNQHKASQGDFVVSAAKNSKYGFESFLGKPIFFEHFNDSPKRARGVIVDAKLHVQDHKIASLDPFYSSPEAEDYHMPPTWVELLLEIDAQTFPKFANAIIEGAKDPTKGIDGFSMGSNISKSACNICGNEAEDESQFCTHIRMKGAQFKAIDSKTGKKVMKRSAEKCMGVSFFEISGVISPADDTALIREIITHEGRNKTASNWNARLGAAPNMLNPTRRCPACGQGTLDPEHNNKCATCGFHDGSAVTAAGADPDPNAMGEERYLEMPCPQCQGVGFVNGIDCPGCGGDGMVGNGMYAQPRGDITGLIGRNPEDYPKMPVPLQDALYNVTPYQGSVKTAEGDLPQADLLSVPEKVDTLRRPEVCDVCGSEREHNEKCPTCGYAPPPDSLDNPDLTKSQDMANQNVPPGGTAIEGYPDPQMEAQTPPPATVAPNFQSSSHVINDMDWEFFHPKLGRGVLSGKINPIERPVLPNGPPATNEPTKEVIVSQPSGPITSRTAASMIAAVKQKENNMKTADMPEAATPDANVDVVDVGGVMDASNEEASKADAQVDLLDTGETPAHDVAPDGHQSTQTAGPDSDDSGFSTEHTTDGSGPTMTWSLVDTQHDPVTQETLEGDEGVKKSALDAEPFPSDGGPDLAGGGAVSGTEPADPVGKAQDRVDVLSPATTPESNNSGPTITWTGTDGNKVQRQHDPVTPETLEEPDGVKKSFMHFVNASRLADMEIEMGVLSQDDKYNRLAALAETDPRIIQTQLETYSKVKTAGLRKPASVLRTAGTRLPSMNKTASIAPLPSPTIVDEGLFL